MERNIYKIGKELFITSDEEIKEGDYGLIGKEVGKIILTEDGYEFLIGKGVSYEYGDYHSLQKVCKKIILTTDQDLIKDGVQAIDDEFLEWFVKNPSCESVKVDKVEDELISPKNPKIRFNALQDPPSFISAESLNNMILTYKYKIIIPKEEPKTGSMSECIKIIIDNQLNDLEEPEQELSIRLQNSLTQFNLSIEEALELEDWKLKTIGFSNKSIIEINSLKPKQTVEEYEQQGMEKYAHEFKQETLEEVAEKSAIEQFEAGSTTYILGFIEGVKWQQEQDKNKYSEEEVELIANEMVNWAIDNIGNPFPQSGKKFDEVIAKFKNK
jgi:hypothetical protein